MKNLIKVEPKCMKQRKKEWKEEKWNKCRKNKKIKYIKKKTQLGNK